MRTNIIRLASIAGMLAAPLAVRIATDNSLTLDADLLNAAETLIQRKMKTETEQTATTTPQQQPLHNPQLSSQMQKAAADAAILKNALGGDIRI